MWPNGNVGNKTEKLLRARAGERERILLGLLLEAWLEGTDGHGPEGRW